MNEDYSVTDSLAAETTKERLRNGRATAHRMGILLAVPATIGIAALVAVNSNRGNETSAAPREAGVTKDSPVNFTTKGELLRPTGYRRWTYVGTPLTPNHLNGGKAAFPEFHAVYINPEAFNHYEKAGEWPDGTVLVKELLSVGARQASSGKGYFMGDFTGLEVAIKDKRRFKDQPGNWAYFSFGHEYPLADSIKPQAVANCSSCHGALAAEDFVFTQYYPVLRAAKRTAKSN